MQHQPLQQVIDTENEIRHRIAAERDQAAARLRTVEERCEQEKAAERQRLEEAFNRAIEESRRQRRAVAERMLVDADRQARSLGEVEEKRLREILRRHLGFILPERTVEENG